MSHTARDIPHLAMDVADIGKGIRFHCEGILQIATNGTMPRETEEQYFVT